MQDIICSNPNCKYSGQPKLVPKGSCLVALLLCTFGILPGIIYFIIKSGYRMYCPQCGMQLGEVEGDGNQRIGYIIGAVFLLLIIVGAFANMRSERLEEETKITEAEQEALRMRRFEEIEREAKESRQKKIDSYFNPDGSHKVMLKMLSKIYSDNEKVEHIKTKRFDFGDFLIIAGKFKITDPFKEYETTYGIMIDKNNTIREIYNNQSKVETALYKAENQK